MAQRFAAVGPKDIGRLSQQANRGQVTQFWPCLRLTFLQTVADSSGEVVSPPAEAMQLDNLGFRPPIEQAVMYFKGFPMNTTCFPLLRLNCPCFD